MKYSQQSNQQSKLGVPENIDNVSLSHAKAGHSTETDEARSQSKFDNGLTAILKVAEEEHQYLREYIRNADQKAIFFFTISSGLLVFLNSQHASARWLKTLSKWNMLDLSAFLAMASLAIAAIFFLLTVVPRLKGSKKGLIFFNGVAEYTNSDEYVSDISRCSEAEIGRMKLKHCYELAKICKTKYNKLTWGLYIGAGAFIFSIIYLLLT